MPFTLANRHDVDRAIPVRVANPVASRRFIEIEEVVGEQILFTAIIQELVPPDRGLFLDNVLLEIVNRIEFLQDNGQVEAIEDVADVALVEAQEERVFTVGVLAIADGQAAIDIIGGVRFASFFGAVGHYDFVDGVGGGVDWNRKGNGALGIQKYLLRVFQQVVPRAGGGCDLLVDRFLLPALPLQAAIFRGIHKFVAGAVEEQEDPVFEHDQQVAEFFPFRFIGVWIGPEAQECRVAQLSQILFGRRLANRFGNDRASGDHKSILCLSSNWERCAG